MQHCLVSARARRNPELLIGCEKRRRQRTETSKPSRRGREDPRVTIFRSTFYCSVPKSSLAWRPTAGSLARLANWNGEGPQWEICITALAHDSASLRRRICKAVSGRCFVEVRSCDAQAPSSDSRTSSEKRRRLSKSAEVPALVLASFALLGPRLHAATDKAFAQASVLTG